MSNKERYVLEALQKAITTATSFSTIPVKYVGRSIEGDKWLEIVYIPNNVEDEFLSGGKTYQGIVRLILHWPMEDEGVYEPMDYLSQVADNLPKGSRYEDPSSNVIVKITDHPDTKSPMEEAPELLISMTLKYSCFLP